MTTAVDPWVLSSDIVGNVVTIALPAVLWFLLFWMAWERPDFARRSGFGRETFWLLLVAALLGSLFGIIGVLPLIPIQKDILALSIGGGFIPVLLASILFGRLFGEFWRSLALFWGCFVVESAILLLVVLFLPSTIAGILVLVALAGVLPLPVIFAPRLFARLRAPADEVLFRRVGLFLEITSGVIVLTYLTTFSQAGVGISSYFPLYLVAPIVAGAIAVLTIQRGFGLWYGYALPLAYATATFGTLVGADILRQPPLYGGSTSGIYAIGGAGVGDLLYLTGLVAFAAAFTILLLGKQIPRATPEPPPSDAWAGPTPFGLLRRAYRTGTQGPPGGATREAEHASREAAAQTRRLVGLAGPPPAERPWEGLPVPPWVAADQANLDALAASSSPDPRDDYRAWMTARWLVRVGQDTGRARFANPRRRFAAFGMDLVFVTIPAVLVWILAVQLVPGTTNDVLNNTFFNAAAIGFPAWAFVYFVVFEVLFGTTPGKRLFGLVVRTRTLERPKTIPILVRDSPKLIPLTVIGIGGALLVALLLRGPVSGTSLVSASSLVPSEFLALASVGAAIAVGVGICALVALLGITVSSENQRAGDYLAGTWVVREVSVPPPGAVVASPPPGRPPSG